MDDINRADEQTPSVLSVSDSKSVRMVQIAHFMPKHERDALYNAVCANQGTFQQLETPGGDGGPALYLSLESTAFDRPGVTPVREACTFLSNRIREVLPSLFTALAVEPFAVPEIPLNLVNGLDGHFGFPHADSTNGRFRISLLYYFHRVPKAFRGGALEFYAADAESPKGHSDDVHTRIEHQDNLLIAFPSHTFHGITDVRCDSDDFADGRFTAIGFLGPK